MVECLSSTDRAKLDALAVRVGRGFDVLFQREQEVRMDASYEAWYGTWAGLLSEYEALLTRHGVTR